MKNPKKKLTIKKSSLKELAATELKSVVGGAAGTTTGTVGSASTTGR